MKTICDKCKTKECLKSGKPCEKVEALLPKNTTGRNKKELIFDSQVLETIGNLRAIELQYGKNQLKKAIKERRNGEL